MFWAHKNLHERASRGSAFLVRLRGLFSQLPLPRLIPAGFTAGMVLTFILSGVFLHLSKSRRAVGTESNENAPVRMVARGIALPTVIRGRDVPLRLCPVDHLPDVVTDEQLVTALTAALPLWHPPSVPSLMHELHVWGRNAHFTKQMVGEDLSGQSIVETLLSDKLCRERTAPLGSVYLLDTSYGIHVVKIGSHDASELRGEAHTGQLLKKLAEAGVSLSTPVTTESGRIGAVSDLFQDATLRFSLAGEIDFMAVPLALWLPPQKSWIDQYGTEHTFDELMMALLDRPLGSGACGGCHVPYAVTTLVRIDEDQHFLSPAVRERALNWLTALSALLTRMQQISGGGWDRNWAEASSNGSIFNDDSLDRITVTGHHLEWMAMAPPETRPRPDVIARAVIALTNDINDLPEMRIRSFKTLLPCAHAARALCLFLGRDPFTAWKTFWDENRITPDLRRGYRLKTVLDSSR